MVTISFFDKISAILIPSTCIKTKVFSIIPKHFFSQGFFYRSRISSNEIFNLFYRCDNFILQVNRWLSRMDLFTISILYEFTWILVQILHVYSKEIWNFVSMRERYEICDWNQRTLNARSIIWKNRKISMILEQIIGNYKFTLDFSFTTSYCC